MLRHVGAPWEVNNGDELDGVFKQESIKMDQTSP